MNTRTNAQESNGRPSKYPDGTNRKKQPRDPHPAALAFGVDDAARVLGISRRSIYGLIAEKRLTPAKLCGRTIITRVELERLVAEIASEAA